MNATLFCVVKSSKIESISILVIMHNTNKYSHDKQNSLAFGKILI